MKKVTVFNNYRMGADILSTRQEMRTENPEAFSDYKEFVSEVNNQPGVEKEYTLSDIGVTHRGGFFALLKSRDIKISHIIIIAESDDGSVMHDLMSDQTKFNKKNSNWEDMNPKQLAKAIRSFYDDDDDDDLWDDLASGAGAQ